MSVQGEHAGSCSQAEHPEERVTQKKTINLQCPPGVFVVLWVISGINQKLPGM